MLLCKKSLSKMYKCRYHGKHHHLFNSLFTFYKQYMKIIVQWWIQAPNVQQQLGSSSCWTICDSFHASFHFKRMIQSTSCLSSPRCGMVAIAEKVFISSMSPCTIIFHPWAMNNSHYLQVTKKFSE